MENDETKSVLPKGLVVLIRFLGLVIYLPTAWLLSIIGTSYSRNRNGSLETATRLYVQPRTGRRIVLVGVIHIARPAYYQEVQNLIDVSEGQGFKVLYEMVGKITDEELLLLHPKEQTIVSQLRQISMIMRRIPKEWFDGQLVNQADSLRYADDWIRTDLDIGDIARMFIERKVKFFTLPAPSEMKVDKLPDEFVYLAQGFFGFILRLLPGMSIVSSCVKIFNRNHRERQRIILDVRNDVGAKGILDQTNQGFDTISIWGAAHLPGMHKQLVKAGFRHTKTQWLPAF